MMTRSLHTTLRSINVAPKGSLFVSLIPPSFWARWARRLTEPGEAEDLLRVDDLRMASLPRRGELVLDPILSRILASQYEERHANYAQTISSWARYTTRPTSSSRAAALGAMSASAFLMDDLVDGWENTISKLDVSRQLRSQEQLVNSLIRRSRPFWPSSVAFIDAVMATRRASDLAYALRPSDRWWNDYTREMASFVYGRSISCLLLERRLILTPELYLRTRILDVGASMATTFASLAVDAYPERSRTLIELWALCWLHLIITNDLYSYYRERDESAFNVVHVVQASLSRSSPTSVAQAVDRAVRLCNHLFARARYLSEALTLGQDEDSEIVKHVNAVLLTVTGGLEFLHAHGNRYRDPATLPDYEVALHRVADAYGQVWWDRSTHWEEILSFVEAHQPTALCIASWRFALGEDGVATEHLTVTTSTLADLRRVVESPHLWRPKVNPFLSLNVGQ